MKVYPSFLSILFHQPNKLLPKVKHNKKDKLTNDAKEQKKSYGSNMKANSEENTNLMCPKIRAKSHYAKKCCSFEYPIKHF